MATKPKPISVYFNPTRERWSAAAALFRDIGHEDLAEEPQQSFGYSLKFADEAALARFVEGADARGLTYLIRRSRDLRADEVDVPLIRLKITSKEVGRGGPMYGTEYDLSSGCIHCGTGALQMTPLVLRAQDAPASNVWSTLDGEVLIRSELADEVRGVSGAE